VRLDVLAVVKILNNLKKQHRIRDYAIFGATAASYYMEPVYTEDVDVLILASGDEEYIKVWRELSKYGEDLKDFGFIIAETEVQIFPTSVHPLFEDSLKKARRIKVGGIGTKIVDKEHLILLFLKANRVKDKFKAAILLQDVNLPYLTELLERFDTDGKLQEAIKSLPKSSNP
jgi:predicted nucleotidyltransferase